MSKVYRIDVKGKTTAMKRIHCSNEEKELQNLLERNYDLLAGDQINPEEPRRWLLIKKEMPVPDPTSGAARWSIDLFFVDQTGMPTFVECKRYQDTRSRREVVGQMMEYAANAQFYWDKDKIKNVAEKTANEREESLENLLSSLQRDDFSSVDDFFENVENSLKEGQIRLVFFLEEAPHELRSIVEFLNNQMERSEVLIVEARQYSEDGVKIVVPTLFGYTEQARRIKKTVSVTSTRFKWTRETLINDVEKANVPVRLSRMKDLLKWADGNAETISLGYGTGGISGSVIFRNNAGLSVLVVYSHGGVQLPGTKDKFEFLVSLNKKYDKWLEWKGELEPGKWPYMVKTIEEMSGEEFEKLKEFTLKMANGFMEVE